MSGIDVENPNPGQRPGQIHYQPKKDVNWYYEPKRDKFYDQETGKDAPQSVQEKPKDPGIRAGIDQGLTMPGEK
jgi:hypothetical protein